MYTFLLERRTPKARPTTDLNLEIKTEQRSRARASSSFSTVSRFIKLSRTNLLSIIVIDVHFKRKFGVYYKMRLDNSGFLGNVGLILRKTGSDRSRFLETTNYLAVVLDVDNSIAPKPVKIHNCR